MNEKIQMQAIHCFISGRVQGVSFRYYTYREALRLGVTGWVRNLSDGRVEVLAYGESIVINQLQQWLQQGSPFARVDKVDCQLVEIITVPNTFEIA